MRSPRYLSSVLALVAATACGSANATPIRAAVEPTAPLASVRLVNRLADREAAMIPSVHGQSVTRARRTLNGLTVHVVEFGKPKDPISAQWPPAGDPRPADGNVVVWVGEPPAAKAPPQPAAAAAPPVPSGPPFELPDAKEPLSGADSAPVPQSGVTPGLEDMEPPPHPPRSNIRTLPAATSGTALAGRASWYGPGFAGRQTACGGTFDPSALTLASRELRCGTVVTVTGPTGRTTQATVTDWGPAEWTNRRFDLSQGTFAAVAGLGAGVIDVTVTVR